MPYELNSFNRTNRKVPYMGFYYANNSLHLLPSNSFVIIHSGQTNITNEDLQAKNLKPVVMFGMGENEFTNTSAYINHINEQKQWLNSRNITPLAVMVGEEWYPGMTADPTIRNWAIFNNVNEYQRREIIQNRLGICLGVLKQNFPTAYTVHVEPLWNNDNNYPSYYYAPIPDNLDVIGCDPYLSSYNLSPDVSQDMLNKFWQEVGIVLEGGWVANSLNPLVGACNYGKPVMLVGQTFKIQQNGTLFSKSPSPGQLDWFYRLAQRRNEIVAMAFFCRENVGDISNIEAVYGLESLPDLANQVSNIISYNNEIPT